MHERILRDFFLGAATVADLKSDLETALVRVTADVTRHPIVDMDEEFEVRPAHLITVCDAVLSGGLDPWMLEPIGFCLVASDRFWWDGDTARGASAAEVVYDWASPGTNYVLNHTTARKFRLRLVTGENTFTREDTWARWRGA